MTHVTLVDQVLVLQHLVVKTIQAIHDLKSAVIEHVAVAMDRYPVLRLESIATAVNALLILTMVKDAAFFAMVTKLRLAKQAQWGAAQTIAAGFAKNAIFLVDGANRKKTGLVSARVANAACVLNVIQIQTAVILVYVYTLLDCVATA